MATKQATQAASSLSNRQKRIAERESQRKHQQQQRTLFLGLGALVVGLLAFFLIRSVSAPKPGQFVADLGNRHIDQSLVGTVSYNSTPPTSGPHLGNLAPWGIHPQPIPNELQVHNLEDGGVMVQYNCPDGCPDLVAQLAEIVKPFDHGVVLAPYPDMESRIALTAWTRIDTFDDFDAERIERFIKAYRGIDHHVAGQG
ncbi:MAG TPA: DUF3105 domain-containing protein [Anaerolineae bacterium]|nr:DUF3105 domain-containing protein [Anaerolineae bacterium]